jgi:acetolactate synthase I/II/III large subunit
MAKPGSRGSRSEDAAVALARVIRDCGTTHVFGVPGTQTIDFWEGLRKTTLPRTVVATNELSAAFMANGYARATGRVGVVATIPGPGFTYALTGVAEALLDSVALVHVTGAPARSETGEFGLQGIAQEALGAALAKRSFIVGSGSDLLPFAREAFAAAAGGEPGPVLLQIPEAVMRGTVEPEDRASVTAEVQPKPGDVEAVAARIRAAQRPLVFAGQGAAGAAAAVRALAELLPAPVITTTSGRGVLPEDHPCCLCFDSPGSPKRAVADLFSASDLVLALGVKFSHNGTHGGALPFDPATLVHVDTAPGNLGTAVHADADAFLQRLNPTLAGSASTWDEAAIGDWRRRLETAAASASEPTVGGGTASEAFASLRKWLPPTGVVTADSGLHQYLARRHLRVLAPRTFLIPSDFQSMGYGIPAAIGAALGTGERAVAVVGDGGFAMTALELATAVQERVALTVLVLVDGAFGLIRRQQVRRTGHESGVELPRISVADVASAVGAQHRSAEAGTIDDVLREALGSPGVYVVEIGMDDGPTRRRDQRRAALVSAARGALGRRGMELVMRRRSG